MVDTRSKRLTTPEADPPAQTPGTAGRDETTAAGNGRVFTTPSLPAAVPAYPDMAAHLADLRAGMGDCYSFAACVLDGAECWTALRQDAVPGYRTADWITAGSFGEMMWLARHDHDSRPVPSGRRLRYRDDLLERLCARFPGWALVRLPDGLLLGRRGHVEAGPVAQAAMGSAIGQAGYEAARSACPR